jgi:ribosomal protein L20
VRVLVAAVNADGHDFAPSAATNVVDSKNGSKNTARPAVSGDATVGGELSVSNGSWTPAPASYGYQWQRCDTDGTNCLNVAGANGQTYGVRVVDVGNLMRAIVVARTQAGDRAYVTSGYTDVVQTDQPPVQSNKPPTIRFLGLTRVGARMYARFRICDDGTGKVTIVERDIKARVAAYTRKFAVRINAACRNADLSYSKFMHGLKMAGVDLNRKVLAELAMADESAFRLLADRAKAALEKA